MWFNMFLKQNFMNQNPVKRKRNLVEEIQGIPTSAIIKNKISE